MNISLNNNNNRLFIVTQIQCVLCEVGAEVLFTHTSRCRGREFRVRNEVGKCEVRGGQSGGGEFFFCNEFSLRTSISCNNGSNKEQKFYTYGHLPIVLYCGRVPAADAPGCTAA